MEDLPRSARATRGKRLTRLVDDEADADNSFWGQDAFKEENNDKEYEEEAEQVDVFDSDFDEEEPESDHEGEKEEKEVVKKKRKLPYKKPVAGDKKKKSVSFLLKKDKQPKPKKKPAREEDGDEGGESERIVRKSTRMAVVAKQAERAAKAAMHTPKPVKRKREEEKKMSQEEMLLEAAQTEVVNLQSLERMLAREEEVKKRAIIQKVLYTGPQIKFISKDGCNVLEFTKISTLPSVINSKAKHYPERPLCVITGQPARYRDPKTGQPYATKEAFKILRERYLKADKSLRRDSSEEIHQRKRSKVETERDSSRAGFVKLKFKKSPTRDASGAAQHVQASQPSSQPPAYPAGAALAPIQIEDINEADFVLEGLSQVPRSYAIEDSILYETNEMTEASFDSGDFMWSKMLQQKPQQAACQ